MDMLYDDPTVPITIRLPTGMIEQIDSYRSTSEFRPTRSAAIRTLIEAALRDVTLSRKRRVRVGG